ncbi:hypothetical protein ES707_19872 [subsurface metagenome]
MGLPYAEDVGHYWQTSSSSPDTWLEKAKKLIRQLEGNIVAEGYGSLGEHAAYMLAFEVGGDSFKVVWPVLPSRTGKELAAKRQAATLLYHDIKAKAMTASVLGTRAAFFSYMMLSDGRTATELTSPELSREFPLQLKGG